MSKEALESVNARLIEHFKKVGIENACYYQPATEDYWTSPKKIAYCNLEPYSVINDSDRVQGVKPLDSERFYEHWYWSKTGRWTVFTNYIMSRSLNENKTFSEADARTFRSELKKEKDGGYETECGYFEDKMYFNFRYTQSSKVSADNGYIFGKYINDPFFRQHYRNFVKACEIDVLVVTSKVGAELLTIIYPELEGIFSYCGEPVTVDGTTFVSIPHPSRFGYKKAVDAANKIAKAIK